MAIHWPYGPLSPVAEPRIVPSVFYRDMGLTIPDFLRTLSAAVSPSTYRIEGDLVEIHHPRGTVSIRLQPQPERHLASLSLPVTRVSFDFGELDNAQRCRFMDRFERYFHRGGG